MSLTSYRAAPPRDWISNVFQFRVEGKRKDFKVAEGVCRAGW